DLAMALFTPLRISAPSGVIRRSALIESGLLRDDWRTGCLVLDLWCRLAINHDIGNVDRAIVHGRAGRDVEDFALDEDHLVEDRVRFVESLFEEKSFLANTADLSLQFECLANQLCILNEEVGGTAVDALCRARRDLAYRLVYHVGVERRGFGNIARWHRMWRLPDGFRKLTWMCASSHPDRAAATNRSLAFLVRYARPLCWPF